MKKLVFPFTLIVIAALLLAACGGATAGEVTPGADTGTLETPAAVDTPAGTDAEMTPTLEVTEAATLAPTVEEAATETVEATPAETATEAAEATPTTATGGAGEATNTPAAGTGGTGGTGGTVAEGQYVRLSTLLSSQVTTNDNQPAGEVDGVLVEHPTPPLAEEGEEGDAAATPEATPTMAVAEEGSLDFTVRYILVDTAAIYDTTGNTGSPAAQRGGNIAVIPWQAFDMAAATGAATSVGTLTLNAEADALVNAPRARLSEVAGGSAAWSGDVASFWTGEGVAGIPATGAVNMENLALIPRDFRSITVADQEGSDLGSVADFIIDPATGQVLHVVFEGGETFNNRTFAVPVSHLTWSGNTGTQLGSFQFNFPNDALNTAPFFDSLDGIDLGQDWNEEVNEFWNNFQGGAGTDAGEATATPAP